MLGVFYSDVSHVKIQSYFYASIMFIRSMPDTSRHDPRARNNDHRILVTTRHLQHSHRASTSEVLLTMATMPCSIYVRSIKSAWASGQPRASLVR